MHTYIYIYVVLFIYIEREIYIFRDIHIHTCIYIYTYMEREREVLFYLLGYDIICYTISIHCDIGALRLGPGARALLAELRGHGQASVI